MIQAAIDFEAARRARDEGMARAQSHAEVAEYRLRHQGIKPELLRYLKGIGEAYR
jgi:hypothetical protein